MNEAELRALSMRLAALADALEDRSHEAVQAMNTSGERLDQTAHNLSQNVQRLTSEATRAMGAEAHAAVARGVQQAANLCADTLERAARQATESAHALQIQNDALQRAQRALVWRASLGLLVGAVLATAVSAYAFWQNTQAAQSLEFGSAVVRATQAGTLTQCGDALCVKLPRNAPRFSQNTDYVLIP